MCRYKGSGVQVRHYDYLHHNHAGVVSLSGDASEVAVTLTKAIYLDSSYQVQSSHLCYLGRQGISVKLECKGTA